MSDNNNEKAVTGQVSFGTDNFSAAYSVVWGEESGTAPKDADRGYHDFLVSVDSGNLSMWANYTLVTAEHLGKSHGLAIAARIGLTEACGIALRAESVTLDPKKGGGDSDTAYSLTATGDYALTDHLQLKSEFRIDMDADKFTDKKNTPNKNDEAYLLIAQLVYTF